MSQSNAANNNSEFNAKDQEYCEECKQEIEECTCADE